MKVFHAITLFSGQWSQGCGRATLYSCPRAPALRRPLARGDSAPMWVQGQCGTARRPLVYLLLLNCGNHCVPAVYGVVGEWPWRTTLIWLLFFPVFFFLLEYTCFTMLCWFLLYNTANQSPLDHQRCPLSSIQYIHCLATITIIYLQNVFIFPHYSSVPIKE